MRKGLVYIGRTAVPCRQVWYLTELCVGDRTAFELHVRKCSRCTQELEESGSPADLADKYRPDPDKEGDSAILETANHLPKSRMEVADAGQNLKLGLAELTQPQGRRMAVRLVRAATFGLLMSVAMSGLTAHGIVRDSLDCPRSKDIGLVCDADVYDFGRITITEAAGCTHRFVLRNTGAQPITILEQSSTCGCTTAELPKKSVAPGECLDVLVKTKWSSRAGGQKETVFLKTDCPATPQIRLTVRGFVVVRAILSADVLDFGLLKPGQEKTQVVSLIQGADPRPFRVHSVNSSSERFSVSRLNDSNGTDQNSPSQGRRCNFAVTFTAPRLRNRYKEVIEFHTDIEDQPVLKLNIRAASCGTLSSVPNSLFFTGDGQKPDNLREIRIDHADVDTPLAAEIVPKQRGISPFYIKDIKDDKGSGQTSKIITVGFRKNAINHLLCQGTLRVNVGAQVLDIPIVALGEHKTIR